MGINQVALGQIIVFKHKRPSFPCDTPPALRNLAELCWHPIALPLRQSSKSCRRSGLNFKRSLGPGSSPRWDQRLVLDEARGSRGSPADALSTAKYNSQASSGGFDDWMPTIAGDGKGLIETRPGSDAEFSNQATFVDPRTAKPQKGSGLKASEGLQSPTHSGGGDSISLADPSSGLPSVHLSVHSHSSNNSSTKASKDKGSSGASRKDRMLESEDKGSKTLSFKTVESINAEHSASLPKKPVSEIISSTNFAFANSPSPAPLHSPPSPSPSPTKVLVDFSDLKQAVGKAGSTRLISQHQPMPAMTTIKISLKAPSLQHFLNAPASAPDTVFTRGSSPVSLNSTEITPFVEETHEDCPSPPPPTLDQLKNAGKQKDKSSPNKLLSPFPNLPPKIQETLNPPPAATDVGSPLSPPTRPRISAGRAAVRGRALPIAIRSSAQLPLAKEGWRGRWRVFHQKQRGHWAQVVQSLGLSNGKNEGPR